MIKNIVTDQTNNTYEYLPLLTTYANTTTIFTYSQRQNSST